MAYLFQKCRDNSWDEVLRVLQERPALAMAKIAMDNFVITTTLHQAIVSKGNVETRAQVITTILRQTPESARLRNGYGSLPLHVIAQRNTKLTSQIKEQLMELLIATNPDALLEAGGVGRRTPLHICYTDYMSPQLTKLMVENGKRACFMVDKKGYLPAHIACSRHCSPVKLQMLLDVYPAALYHATNDGQTLLSLATSTATVAHPNYRLIEYLQTLLRESGNQTLISAPVVALMESPPPLMTEMPARKRRQTSKESPETSARKRQKNSKEDPASLLLHFSRNVLDVQENREPDLVASVPV